MLPAFTPLPLPKPAWMALPSYVLKDDEIQFSGLNAFSEHEIEFEVNGRCKSYYKHGRDDAYDFLFHHYYNCCCGRNAGVFLRTADSCKNNKFEVYSKMPAQYRSAMNGVCCLLIYGLTFPVLISSQSFTLS